MEYKLFNFRNYKRESLIKIIEKKNESGATTKVIKRPHRYRVIYVVG